MTPRFQILLFEDNDADVFLVRNALEEAGLSYDLEVSGDGEAAIGLIGRINAGQADPPALLLLDLNLPKYSGEEILEQVRQGERTRACPVIVLTSSDSPRDRARMAALGVQHYFRKPPDYARFLELGQVIRRSLEKYSTGGA